MSVGKIVLLIFASLIAIWVIAVMTSDEKTLPGDVGHCDGDSLKLAIKGVLQRARKISTPAVIKNVSGTQDGNSVACAGELDGKPLRYKITIVPKSERATIPNVNGVVPESIEFDGWKHKRPGS